jgi:LmbE family N-acetylglucosaminyl deacetylase
MNKKILIIGAHPDDEVLGCGGIIKKHASEKDKVFVLILTNGSSIRYVDEMEQTLQRNCQECSEILGAKEVFFENLPEQKLDAIPVINIVQKIEAIIKKVKPEIVYTHHQGDINQDHRTVFEATLIAARPNNSYVKAIYSYEIPSSTEWGSNSEKNIFIPNIFIDISKEIDEKIKAFKKYYSEVENWPHPRSDQGIRTLAQYRSSQCNKFYAEAFKLIREIK